MNKNEAWDQIENSLDISKMLPFQKGICPLYIVGLYAVAMRVLTAQTENEAVCSVLKN